MRLVCVVLCFRSSVTFELIRLFFLMIRRAPRSTRTHTLSLHDALPIYMETVARVIGHKPGTGGSSVVNYLVKALNLSFFPELWSMRTEMVAPRQGGDYGGGDYAQGAGG